MRARAFSKLTERPIRRIRMVIDVEDPLKPELPIEEFLKLYGEDPSPTKYRITTIEIVTCSEDLQPVLVSECGTCPKFVRRLGDKIYCKKPISIEY